MEDDHATPVFSTIDSHQEETSYPTLDQVRKRPGYASLVNVHKALQIIDSEQLSVGDKLDTSKLEIKGEMSRGKSYEVRMTLRHLDLLDQEHHITSVCEQLVHASGEHYRELLRAQIQARYSDLLERLAILPYVNHELLKEAFKQCGYEPVSMQPKMLRLFKGLSREAGIIIERTAPLKDADEQTIEANPILPEKALAPIEGDGHTEESFFISYTPSFIRRETSESDLILNCLFHLPHCRDWTDADTSWWQQAVAQATTTTTEKILHTLKDKRREGEEL